MKKILILGGGPNQLPLINAAKKLGYYSILCDYSNESLGRKLCDKFYCISILDSDKILEVCKSESVDGIFTNSEPAVDICSYIGNILNLPSNPYKSIKLLKNKELFRKFLLENGFNVPRFSHNKTYEEAKKNIENFNYPIMVKPTDSSGSRGVTKITTSSQLKDSFEYALSFSKSKSIIIEEYIDKKYDFVIGGDAFVYKGEVIFWGVMNSMRDLSISEFVPVGTSFPSFITEEEMINVKESVSKLIKLLNINFGAFNIEIMFDKNGKLYFIELNPRNGGNKIPDILKYSTNIDLFSFAIKAAVGDEIKDFFKINDVEKYYSTYVVHSNKSGILKNIEYDKLVERCIVERDIIKNKGEKVNYFSNAEDLIEIIFLKFNTLDDMKYTLENINDFVKVNII